MACTCRQRGAGATFFYQRKTPSCWGQFFGMFDGADYDDDVDIGAIQAKASMKV